MKALGSPPRMRGKVRCVERLPLPDRITPAYAGKRKQHWEVNILSWDHPRVCGEKYKRCAMVSHDEGSPPRMRGKEGLAALVLLELGITPAYAGKRQSQNDSRPLAEDHPRVCGEKFIAAPFTSGVLGSPPRMRGKALPFLLCPVSGGITPAYAGKRVLPQLRPPALWDHPRVCGEKKSGQVNTPAR